MSKKTMLIILGSSAVVAGGIYWKMKVPLANGQELSTTKKVISGALLGLAFSSFVIVMMEIIKK